MVAGLVIAAKNNFTADLRATSGSTGEVKVRKEGGTTYITIPSFADIAEKVIPAVVSIEAEGEEVLNLPSDPFFEFFFGPYPRIRKRMSLGSGFVFLKEGDHYFVMTNHHVVKGMSRIKVKLSDGTTYDDVEIVGADSTTDIAVLRIKTGDKLPLVKLGNSDDLRIGDWVMAIGSPFGFSGTITVGVVSAKHREIGALPEGPSIQDFIQTDAAINPGNSGGPLVNVRGEVVGVNTAIFSPTRAYAGIGFAVPINIAKKVAEQLIKHGKVRRGYLGIIMQNVDENLAKALGLKKARGVIISEVIKGSPADKAGLKEGDVILEVDGRKVKNVFTLRSIIQSKMPGERVKVKLLRDGKEMTVEVELGALEGRAAFRIGGNTLVDEEIGITASYERGRVIVREVKPNSPAGRIGQIDVGDVILKVNNRDIRDLNDLEEAFSEAKKKGSVLMLLESPRGMKKWIGFSL